ncbi:unnamed protein product [Gongylonema pulchrum]|uniref:TRANSKETOLASE_1 domain-containing protein n=1 Tax=Gongylonema pulchrum TaxID=637853 RepID=A0A183EH60_9BILA|nr:unnamed protein product [Gongylonema pulchrum]
MVGEKVEALELYDMANRLRISSIEMTAASKSGHPTSSCSAAEIIATLFFGEMKFDKKQPKNPSADRFGHACPVLYAVWHELGHLTRDDMMSLRKLGSDIEGHPTPRLDFIDVATGSLGQGLSCAAGMAYVGKYIDKASYRVYCLLGDGECAEGSVWEAVGFASYYKLDNLVAIVDMNRLGQTQQTMFGHDADALAKRFEAFGCHAIVVDGHNVEQLCDAYKSARETKHRPTAIVAKTFKGKGIVGIEDEVVVLIERSAVFLKRAPWKCAVQLGAKNNWHGKPVPLDTIEPIRQLIVQKDDQLKLTNKTPIMDAPDVHLPIGKIKMAPPDYKVGEKVRKCFPKIFFIFWIFPVHC